MASNLDAYMEGTRQHFLGTDYTCSCENLRVNDREAPCTSGFGPHVNQPWMGSAAELGIPHAAYEYEAGCYTPGNWFNKLQALAEQHDLPLNDQSVYDQFLTDPLDAEEYVQFLKTIWNQTDFDSPHARNELLSSSSMLFTTNIPSLQLHLGRIQCSECPKAYTDERTRKGTS
ncbi:hypothetical protein CYLTODRAFT_454484 [Cylindrobasidium torrendii FP15055 ss-10]|uniref:Uncharacterized protein n=1 Tax=Cylindrobasidium torrendii FP15055 ss-10 TaxID=1314674 RepID=A0A0D7BA38_9AGAR|nr:hypothetical protein CYLTODRAFT_454484 [Cylindrobasidium torrendii FP15055 ss-10]